MTTIEVYDYHWSLQRPLEFKMTIEVYDDQCSLQRPVEFMTPIEFRENTCRVYGQPLVFTTTIGAYNNHWSLQ